MFCGRLKTLCNCSLSVIWTIIHHSGWQQPWQKWTLNSLTIIILPLQCNALLCYVMCVCHWCYQGVFQEINILTNRAHLVDVNSILTHTKNLISCCFQVSNSNFTIFNVDGHVLPLNGRMGRGDFPKICSPSMMVHYSVVTTY